MLLEFFHNSVESIKSRTLILRVISENIILSSAQASAIIDEIDDSQWKSDAYIALSSRIHDIENYDFIKNKIWFTDAILRVYNSFGILNLFCPYRPYGKFGLNLSLYEEKIVCKILLGLAESEGMEKFCNITLNGKVIK